MAVQPHAGDIPWRRAARKLAVRLALGHALDATATPLVVASAAGACSLLLRRAGVLPDAAVVAVGGAGVAAVVVLGWRAVRRLGDLKPSALARLDAALGAKDRLLAAAEGAAPWPKFPDTLPPIVSWRWSRLAAAPALACAVLAAAAAVLPIAPAAAPTIAPTQRPPVFDELAQVVEELKQDEAVSPAAIDQLGKSLDELLQRDSASLYSHGTLEAAARLLDQTASGAGELSAGLAAAEAALTQLSDASDPAANRDAHTSLDSALRALEHAALPVNPALAGALRDAQAGSLSPQQMASLSRQLRNACSRPREGQGTAQMNFPRRAGTPSQPRDGRGTCRPGSGNGQGGEPGDGSGTGAATRGPGHPPLALASDPSARQEGRDEAVETQDRDQAGLGELISESAGAPRTDPLAAPVTGSGGALAEPGRGADAVRIDELTPEERQAVRRFFQ